MDHTVLSFLLSVLVRGMGIWVLITITSQVIGLEITSVQVLVLTIAFGLSWVSIRL